MSSEYDILLKTTERMGIQDELIIKKTKEFLRIFQTKGSVKALNESAKIILCLDLAATYLGTNFDKESAIKLSGLKKSVYQNNLHTVEKILEIEKPVTVSELCVQIGCTGIKELAENIFQKYKSNSKIEDVGHPQYVAASVYTACRLKNIKIQKSQFIPISHLKPSQWKELTDEFYKFVDSIGIVSPKKKNKNNIINPVTELVEKIDETNNFKREPKDEDCEPYEVWKKRILDEAHQALKGEEKMQE